MLEKPGATHRASTFAENGCPPTAVYATPVFVPVTMNTRHGAGGGEHTVCQSTPQRVRDPGRYVRQSLPLHRL